MLAQEVLRALHAHLGSQAAPQVSAALGALLSLAVSHAAALLSHSSFLMAILDHMDHYSPGQLPTARTPRTQVAQQQWALELRRVCSSSVRRMLSFGPLQ